MAPELYLDLLLESGQSLIEFRLFLLLMWKLKKAHFFLSLFDAVNLVAEIFKLVFPLCIVHQAQISLTLFSSSFFHRVWTVIITDVSKVRLISLLEVLAELDGYIGLLGRCYILFTIEFLLV